MHRRVVIISSVGLLAALTGRIAVPEPTTDDEDRTAPGRNRTTPEEASRERTGTPCGSTRTRIVERTFVPTSRAAYGYFASDRSNDDRDESSVGPIAVRFVPRRNRVLVYGLALASRCNEELKLRSATYDADSDTLSVAVTAGGTPTRSVPPVGSSPSTDSGAPAALGTRSEPGCIPNYGETAYEVIVTFSSRLPTTVVVSAPTGKQRFTR